VRCCVYARAQLNMQHDFNGARAAAAGLSYSASDEVMAMDRVAEDLVAAGAFWTDPINSTRSVGSKSASSWAANMVPAIARFVGFACVAAGEDAVRIRGLGIALDGPVVMSYLGFLFAKRALAYSSLATTVHNLRSVVKWLMVGVEDLDRARKLLAYHVRQDTLQHTLHDILQDNSGLLH